MKKPTGFEEGVLGGPTVPVHIFGAGDVEQILGIESWRLQKFLSGRRYPLKPSGQIGKARQGSRRLFRVEDLYRLAIADFLVKDGFSPKFVCSVLDFIDDSDLLSFGEGGRKRPPVIGAFRGPEGPQFAYRSGRDKESPYYVLDLGQKVDEVDRRVHERSLTSSK